MAEVAYLVDIGNRIEISRRDIVFLNLQQIALERRPAIHVVVHTRMVHAGSVVAVADKRGAALLASRIHESRLPDALEAFEPLERLHEM